MQTKDTSDLIARQVFYTPLISLIHGRLFDNPGELVSRPSVDARLRDLYRTEERLRVLVRSTRLDTVITNADIRRVVFSAQKAREFQYATTFKRRTLDGQLISVPATKMVRSWHTPEGKANIRREMQRRVSKLLDLDAAASEQPKLITLTFRGSEESWRGQYRIRAFLNTLRHSTRGLETTVAYIWSAEIQKRGALHYHLVVTGLPFIPKARLQSWWRHGFADIRATSTSGAARYAAKYIGKATAASSETQDLGSLIFAAAKKRRFGCSRSVSSRPERQAPWLQDLLELCECEEADLEIIEPIGQRSVFVQFKNGRHIWIDQTLCAWRWTRSYWTGLPQSPAVESS